MDKTNIGRTVHGIWLMDEKALRELEDLAKKIFDYIQNSLNEANKNEVDSDNKNNRCTLHEPEIEVGFFDNSSITKRSFQDFFDLLELRKKLPQKISIIIKCTSVNVYLILSSGKIQSNYFRYEILGNNESIDADIIAAKVENWIDEYKPSLLLHCWYYIAKWAFLIMFIAFFVAWVASSIYVNKKNHYFENYKKEISGIAETGVTEENRDRAIELILLKQYEYVPDTWIQENTEVGNRILYVCAIILLIFIFLRICPKSHFAIGKGKRKIKFWNSYIRIVYIVIPSAIILPIIINMIT